MFVYLRRRIHCRSSHCGNPPVRLHSAVCAADSVCDTLRTPGRPSEQYAWPDSVGGEGKRKKEMQLFSEHKLYHFCVAFWFKDLINGRCFRPNFKHFINYCDYVFPKFEFTVGGAPFLRYPAPEYSEQTTEVKSYLLCCFFFLS